MEVSRRLKSIPPYIFAEIDKKRQAAVARGVDVINLGIGDPDEPTPKHIVEAMKTALDNSANHHYPPFGGMKEYKQAAADYIRTLQCQSRSRHRSHFTDRLERRSAQHNHGFYRSRRYQLDPRPCLSGL